MRPDGMKLNTTHLFWFYSVASVLFISGLLWVGLQYSGSGAEDELAMGRNPLAALSLKIHGASAMFYLVIFGTLIPNHIRRGWKAKMNRVNGVIFVVINILLVVTAYGLYYMADEKVRSFSSWVHVLLGLAFPAFLFLHVMLGRRSREHRRARLVRK